MSPGTSLRSHPATAYVAAVLVGVLLAYALVALYVFPVEGSSQKLIVPNVVGSSYEDATRKLSEAGFEAVSGETRASAAAPARTVVAQDPEGGSELNEGGKVTLHLSGGEVKSGGGR